MIAGSRGGDLDGKTDNTWKEVLAKIGEHHPNSVTGEKYRKNKTVKEQKTKEIIRKYEKRAQKEGKL